MSDDFGNLGTGNAVFLCRLEVVDERVVGDTLTDERGNRYQTAVAQTEAVGAAPHFAEEDIVVEFREFGCELAELGSPCRLYNLFLCHNMKS